MYPGKTKIEDFIKNHNHIRYCEAVIYPDGDIEYAMPSHMELLLRITGEDRDVINDKIPITDTPIKWLLNYTKCVGVWYDYMISPSVVTLEQRDSIDKLVHAEIIIIDDF